MRQIPHVPKDLRGLRLHRCRKSHLAYRCRASDASAVGNLGGLVAAVYDARRVTYCWTTAHFSKRSIPWICEYVRWMYGCVRALSAYQ